VQINALTGEYINHGSFYKTIVETTRLPDELSKAEWDMNHRDEDGAAW
jgi:hypothetical protein